MANARDDIKNINAMVKSIDEQLNTLRELTDSMITDIYNLNIGIKEAINKILPSKIESMSEQDCIDFLNTSYNGKGKNKNVENMKIAWKEHKEYENKEFVEFCKYVFLEIKKSLGEIETMENDKEKLMKDIDTISEDYFKYINSPEYREKKLAHIADMEKQADVETNPSKKREILEMLNAMRRSETLDFVYDRIHEDPREINRVIERFFDDNRSSYIINRFKTRIKKFGYNPDIYRRLFNIEEMFLPEEYHDLNNLFLFSVLTLIAYYDTYNKYDSLYTTSILVKMVNLIYHQFGSDEYEKEFIEFIKRYDDQFMSYIDKFKEYNVTSPNHPVRIEKEKEMEENRRNYIISKLNDKNIEVDMTKTTKELGEQLKQIEQDEINAMKAEMEKLANKSDEDNVETVDVNGPDVPTEMTAITPNNEGSPFTIDQIKAMTDASKEPIDIIHICQEESSVACVNVNLYSVIDPSKKYLLGLDYGTSITSNDCAFTLIDTDTTEVVADMVDSDLTINEYVNAIHTFVADTVPNAIIIGTRNNVGLAVLTALQETDINTQIYYENKDENNNKIYGVTATTKFYASILNILMDRVNNYSSKFISKNIIKDIRKLTVTKDSHIAPINGTCASLNSYLNAMYVFAYAKNLDIDKQLTVNPGIKSVNTVVRSEEEFNKIMKEMESKKEFTDFEEELEKVSDELASDGSHNIPEDANKVGDKLNQERMDIDEVDTKPVVDDNTNSCLQSVEVYVDGFGYYYQMKEPGMYSYYTKEHELYEDNVSEDVVLRLLSTGAITKKIIEI